MIDYLLGLVHEGKLKYEYVMWYHSTLIGLQLIFLTCPFIWRILLYEAWRQKWWIFWNVNLHAGWRLFHSVSSAWLWRRPWANMEASQSKLWGSEMKDEVRLQGSSKYPSHWWVHSYSWLCQVLGRATWEFCKEKGCSVFGRLARFLSERVHQSFIAMKGPSEWITTRCSCTHGLCVKVFLFLKYAICSICLGWWLIRI